MFSLSRGDRDGIDFWGMVRDCCLEGVRALIPISPPPLATKSSHSARRDRAPSLERTPLPHRGHSVAAAPR